MKRRLAGLLLLTAIVFGSTTLTAAGPPTPCDNLGQLTAWAILELEGWDQGQHSADPSGDGLGPEDRVGLANIIATGDLGAVLAFLVSVLNPGGC